MRTITLSGQDFIVNPLKGKDIKALKAQGFDLMAAGIRFPRAWTPCSPSPVRRGPDGRTALPRHPRPAQGHRERNLRRGGRRKKLAAVWEWLSGEGAEYCDACRKAARNRDDLDCEECEGRCPDLMPENAAAWELLQAGATQLRMSGMGGPVGFDYNALALVAEAFGIELTPGMWRKVQAVETVIRRNAAKQAEKTQQASASTR